MQFVKLHLGVVRFLINESKKKHTPSQLVAVLLGLIKAYWREILRQYKSIFLFLDPYYQEEKKKFEKRKQIKQRIQDAGRLLLYAKQQMKQAGISRQRIRRFFLDYGRDDAALEQLIIELMKEAQ